MISQITLQPSSAAAPSAPAAPRDLRPPNETPFSQVLDTQLRRTRTVLFSAHARRRLEDRGITLAAADLTRLARGFDRAAEKGARNALFILDRLGLVASVPNRTVITVVAQDEMTDAVFTNIDSAVLVGAAPAAAESTMASDGPDPLRGGLGAADR